MYLIDTCTFLWSIGDDPLLSKKARVIIEVGRLYRNFLTFTAIHLIG